MLGYNGDLIKEKCINLELLVEGPGDTETGPKGLIQRVSTCGLV